MACAARGGAHRCDLPALAGRAGAGPPAAAARYRARHGTPFEHFLTARWRLHHAVPGITVTAPLCHDRWPLHTAELLEFDDQLIAATGLPVPTTAPASVLYVPDVHGRIGPIMPT